ncbi:MAG TPA: nicotinate-nucleotide diphosphorylase (carboxylating), partial [Solirubrobacteraceae bacterium]|nr:nicotinate-nucleotide diphosphorylase (carboxylating) [Solirubrobacteraceae bacterium]
MVETQSAEIVARALAEDLGDGDVTTAATVPADARAEAVITQKDPGVIFGLDLAEQAFRALDPEATFERAVAEGVWREEGPVLRVQGRARALLS